jgi:tight adherence protein B
LPLRENFSRIALKINQGISFEVALVDEAGILRSATADQTLSALLLAKEFGGRDVTNTLRLLSTFLREHDESIEEIETKFGWVRNSALLGAAAPWLLLALLSTQQNTVDAYQTSSGKAVLSFGVIATAVAYLLMERIARAPNPPRVQILLREDALG